MRLFVAVEICDAMREAAAGAAETIRRTLGRAIDARWVEPEKLHFTVRFIGHVEDDRVPELLTVLVRPLAVEPFEIALDRCGVFPPAGGLRVIWIGLATGLPSLSAMHDEYNRRLAPLRFEADARPYSAHLTLARVKNARKASAASLRDVIPGIPVEAIRCRVDRATIFRSHMSSHGSRYEPLAHADLRDRHTAHE